MDAARVKALVEAHLEGCEVMVQGEGNSYDITVVGEVFTGLRPVQKQQLVYGAITELMAGHDAPVHAIDRLECAAPTTG